MAALAAEEPDSVPAATNPGKRRVDPSSSVSQRAADGRRIPAATKTLLRILLKMKRRIETTNLDEIVLPISN